MNEREKLYEQYEEALLALLMEEVAEAEGKELLEESERLQSDPSAAVPKTATEKCLKIIAQSGRKAKRKKASRRIARWLGRVAIAALAVLLVFGCVLAISEPVRVDTLNFVLERVDIGTIFHLGMERKALRLDPNQIWVPEGFSLEEAREDNAACHYIYKGSGESEIIVSTFKTVLPDENAAGALIVDTEDAEITYITIGDTRIMLVHEGTEYQAVWQAPDGANLIDILARHVAYEEVHKIAESLILGEANSLS